MNQQKEVFNQVYKTREANDQQRKQLQKTEKVGRLLAINGCYDYWDKILPYLRLGIKDLIGPASKTSDLPKPLIEYHVIALGCPGSGNSKEVLSALLNYLKGGGYILTTDLCLGNILTPQITSGGWLGPTLVRVPANVSEFDVNVHVVDSAHPLLTGLPSSFRWQVAAGGHLIEVIDKEKINILLTSPELAKSYSYETIMFEAKVGKGTLIHFISHAYAQNTDPQGMQAAAIILANIFDIAVAKSTIIDMPKPGLPRTFASPPVETEKIKDDKAKTAIISEEPWASDEIVLVQEKMEELGAIIRRGKKHGQYLIGEGFSIKVVTAKELINMGLAKNEKAIGAEPGSLSEFSVEDASFIKSKIDICEPWPGDNIIFLVEKIKEDSIPIKRSSHSGKYLIGRGFKAAIKSASDLINLGYAKKR